MGEWKLQEPTGRTPERRGALFDLAPWMRRALVVIGVAVVALGLIAWSLLSRPSLANQEKHVIPACQQSILDRLRNPDSAQFSNEHVTDAHESVDGRLSYRAVGIVRAENGFGGMTVNAYECSASYSATTERVTGHATLLDD